MQKRVTKEEWIGSEEFFTTTYLTIDLIRKWCKENKWYDAWKAIDLYLFYAKCSNIQETRTIYCTREFASKWLWYSIDTITKYKKALENIWCITQICKKSEDWKVEWRYISIKLATSRVLEPEEVWTHYWFNTPPNTVVNKDINTEVNKDNNNQELNFSDLSELDWGSDEEKQKFIDYWNTLVASKGKKKLRRVAEKTFNIKLRRWTWKKNLWEAQHPISDDIKKEMSPLQLSDMDSKIIYDRCLELWKVSKVLVWRVESWEIAYWAPVMINKYKDWVDIEYIKWIIRKIDEWAAKKWNTIDSYWNLFIKFTDEPNRKN